MPKLSVWMVRASLIHMGIGFLFGALILLHKGIPLYPWLGRLLNPHVELMIFGWTMQLVMGVAFWILPRFGGERHHGNVSLGWWSFGLINGGVLLAASGAWFALGLVVLVGRLATLGAIALFVLLVWARVKPLGGRAAEQRSS